MVGDKKFSKDYTIKIRFSIGYKNWSLDRLLLKTLTSHTPDQWEDSCHDSTYFPANHSSSHHATELDLIMTVVSHFVF